MKNCIACGYSKNILLYPGILKCASCEFVWADIDLTEEQWKKLYGDKYFFGEEYWDYLKEEPALRKNFQRDLKFLNKFCSSGRLLEVGCAYGFFLDEAKKYFEVEGVDIHESGCRYINEHFNFKATCADFLNMSIPPNSYDVIAMLDVLEHLPRPDLFMKKAFDVLKEGGYFFCSTLDISSLLARLQGRSWRQIHPPTHVSYFSKNSLQMMLGRAGFNTIGVRYFGQFRTWDNTLYILLEQRNRHTKLYNYLKEMPLFKSSYYLNTFDHVTCVSIKNSSTLNRRGDA